MGLVFLTCSSLNAFFYSGVRCISDRYGEHKCACEESFRARIEVEGNVVGGLGWAGRKFPLLDSCCRALGEDWIASQNFNVAYRPVRKYPGSYPHQATDLGSLQNFRIVRFYGHEHFALKLWSFLCRRNKNEASGQTQREG